MPRQGTPRCRRCPTALQPMRLCVRLLSSSSEWNSRRTTAWCSCTQGATSSRLCSPPFVAPSTMCISNISTSATTPLERRSSYCLSRRRLRAWRCELCSTASATAATTRRSSASISRPYEPKVCRSRSSTPFVSHGLIMPTTATTARLLSSTVLYVSPAA